MKRLDITIMLAASLWLAILAIFILNCTTDSRSVTLFSNVTEVTASLADTIGYTTMIIAETLIETTIFFNIFTM